MILFSSRVKKMSLYFSEKNGDGFLLFFKNIFLRNRSLRSNATRLCAKATKKNLFYGRTGSSSRVGRSAFFFFFFFFLHTHTCTVYIILAGSLLGFSSSPILLCFLISSSSQFNTETMVTLSI